MTLKKYNLKEQGVTQSILQGFMLCREFARLALERWRPVRVSMPLFFGDLFHAACEFHYDHLTRRKSKQPPPEEAVAFAFRQMKARQEQSRQFRSEQEEQAAEMAIAVLEVLFPAYVRQYAKSDAKLNWIASEHQFEYVYKGVPMRGKLDGVFQQGNRTWIKDTKTKSRLEEGSLLDLLTLDLQIGFYLKAMAGVLNKTIAGFQYDMVRRPELRLKVKETIGQFQRRIAEDIQKRPEHYFKRINVSLSPEDRTRFEFDLDCLLEEFQLWLAGKVPTYHRTAACMTRYGPCRYLPICARRDYTGFARGESVSPELDG